ncbi:MAG: universal stress protein [Phycisphaerales bacterium]|nr:MAG: universal stress protein [Phycisphaerales bacterium]
MERYERILVCIDRSVYDVPLLTYAGGRSRAAVSKEVHFLHVLDDTEHTSHDTAETSPPSIDLSREGLQALVAEHFNGHGQEHLLCELIHGSPLIEILRYAHEKNVDLIMLGRHCGRRVETDDDALLARRITRRATCSVLVLPEEYQLQADAIAVPIRDSECSATALEVACGIAATTGATVTALNVFHVTCGYSRVGATLEEHQALLEAAATRECARLVKRTDTHGVNVECKCAPDLHGKPVRVILEALGSGQGRAVVIGARGRTGAAGVLLGTVTEQLIRKSPSPVLAVKKKGECLGVLRALLVIAGPED